MDLSVLEETKLVMITGFAHHYVVWKTYFRAFFESHGMLLRDHSDSLHIFLG